MYGNLYGFLNFSANLKLLKNRKSTNVLKSGHYNMLPYQFFLTHCPNEKTKIYSSCIELLALQEYFCVFQVPHHSFRSARIGGSGVECGILKHCQSSFIQVFQKMSGRPSFKDVLLGMFALGERSEHTISNFKII